MSTARAEPEAGDMPPVHVLVVAYGDPDALEECLGALGGGYPLVVVDNSSSPRTRAVADRAGATYLDPGENLGFAAAVNLGLGVTALSGADVLLLNPDAVVGVEDLERLRRALHAGPSIACVAPSQRRPGSERASPVCWPFPTPWGAWVEAVGLGRFGHGWGYVIASVLLVRGDAFLDVGGLDEGFFLYAEEADWERRATRRGWTRVVLPGRVGDARGGGHRPRPRLDARSDSTPESRPTCGSGTARWVGTRTSWRRCSPPCGAPLSGGADGGAHRSIWPASMPGGPPARRAGGA